MFGGGDASHPHRNFHVDSVTDTSRRRKHARKSLLRRWVCPIHRPLFREGVLMDRRTVSATFAAATLALIVSGAAVGQTPSGTTVLVDSDHRTAQSLDGDWHYIVDPYDGGLYNFHREIRKDGFFLNGVPETGSQGLIEYDFSKSPTLKVPGDWNTQHESLFNYEGMLWYQRDFTYQPIAGHKTFLHIGAANYKSIAWVNGQ